MKVSVYDVARRAGVSSATVDRVLNGRKGVKEATIHRVQKAAEELGYVPNRLASRLAKGKKYNIAFILPKGSNRFMANLGASVEDIKQDMMAENVVLHVLYWDMWKQNASDELLKLAQGYDGLAVVASDAAEINLAINHLGEDMPVVTLVSDAPSSNRLSYVGIDNMAAGRTAASLLGRFLSSGKKEKLAIIMGSAALRDHMERRAGFEQILHQTYPHLQILPPIYAYDDYKKVHKNLSELFIDNPDITAIYSVGAGNRGVVQTLEEYGLSQKVYVVAHELTQTSRNALISGCFDAVLSQNTEYEVQQSIQILLNALENRKQTKVIKKPNIEIYLKDNLPL
ncbi:MAG: substrate-binding domain-containing protein [Alphaproteobacteria bacterium]